MITLLAFSTTPITTNAPSATHLAINARESRRNNAQNAAVLSFSTKTNVWIPALIIIMASTMFANLAIPLASFAVDQLATNAQAANTLIFCRQPSVKVSLLKIIESLLSFKFLRGCSVRQMLSMPFNLSYLFRPIAISVFFMQSKLSQQFALSTIMCIKLPFENLR